MSRFCGWFGNSLALEDAVGTFEQMSTSLRLQPDKVLKIGKAQVHVAAASEAVFSHESGVVGMISGLPRWKDSDLHDHSIRYGHASTICEAYTTRGTSCLENLGGTFSSVILDSENNLALLAVDRFGIERLCYSMSADGVLVFGPTTDSVCTHPGIDRRIDNQALYNYLYFHMVPSPWTIYEGVEKVEPGQLVSFHRGKIAKQKYCRSRFVDTVNSKTKSPSVLIETLRDSVRNCISDGSPNVGAFLSGGLDSSTVCGILAGLSSKATKAYSIGFSQEGYDEIEFARIAAKHFGLELHEHYVTHKEVAEAIPLIARSYDEPFGNSSAVPAFVCANLAKEDGIDLLLAGDGGDEIFAGNERYARQKLFSLYGRIPKVARNALIEPIFLDSPIGNLIGPTRKVRSYVQQAKIPLPQRLQSYNILDRTELHEMFEAGFLETVDTSCPSVEYERVWREAPTDSDLNRMLFLDWKFTLADNDIRKVNRMCHIAGLSVAYPMLDDDLVDLSMTIPPSQKLKRLELRHFFKAGVSSLLPIEIINKSKHGFGLPFGEWLRKSSELRDIADDTLTRIRNRKILKPTYIDRLTLLHREDHASYYGEMMWVLIMLEQWLTQHGH